MDRTLAREILSHWRPEDVWPGEPLLGSVYGEEELEAVVRTVRASMDWREGFGFICQEIQEFEAAFARYCGSAECISVNSAGTGLDMAVRCLELEPGDEVICPAINFRAAPLAIIGQGGRVILGEVDPRTFQLDPQDVLRRLTPRTRAIVPTHMNGLAAPMDDYLEIAERHPHPRHGPLKVIGDGARAVGGSYRGHKIGSQGWMTVFSFHTMKNITTLGEGGAITTHDPQAARTLRGYRQFGGETDGWGTNTKMTKVQAAVGLVQLGRLDELVARRAQAAHERTRLLTDTPELTLPLEPPDCQHTFYLYTILVPREWAGEKRDRLIRIMREDYRVGCEIANPPVTESSGLIRAHTAGQHLPLSEELGRRLFCPPIHPAMTREQNEYICAALTEAVARVREGG